MGDHRDFDFEHGSWHVSHRRLRERLCGCQDWDVFSGMSQTRPILGGNGNLEDNILNMPDGTYRAVALRSFHPAEGTWAIWWLSTRAPHQLDVPVIGRFQGGVGSFYADDMHGGVPVRVRFLWLDTQGLSPRWEQAMSADGGSSWETNWTMDFTRVNQTGALDDTGVMT